MTNEERPQYSPAEAIARDRFRVWGNLTDQDYLVAWSRRLVEILPVAEPRDEHEAMLQAARRVAAGLIAADDVGEPWPEVDPGDQVSFDELVQTWPDIDVHVRMVTGQGTWEDWEALAHAAPTEPLSIGARLEEHAGEIDDLTRGRFSGGLFLGIFIVPLGCAFVAAFLIAITLLGGILAVIGLRESVVAGQVALVAAIACAAAVVVVVYRKLIPRLPWLRRLINR